MGSTKSEKIVISNVVEKLSDGLVCEICDRDFKNKHGVRSHLAQSHSEKYQSLKDEVRTKVLDYECPECSSRFENELGLSAHILRRCDQVSRGSETWKLGKELRSGENAPLYGESRSDEFKEILSRKQSGERNPQYGKTGEDSPNWNRKLTGKHKEKVAEHLRELTGPGENNPSWKGGCEDYRGYKWGQKRKEVLTRDNEKCVLCGLSRDESKENYGRDLSVHHRKPFEEFDDYKKANEISNLITVCASCHIKVEDLPVQPYRSA